MSGRLFHSREAGWRDDIWDAFVAGHPAAHPLQLSAWGRLKRDFGWEDVRFAWMEEGEIRAGAQVLFRPPPKLGFLPFRIAYAPKGPLVDWQDRRQTAAFLHEVWRFCRNRGALLLKIEPEATDSPALAHRLQALGFRESKRTVQPRTTVWIDLRASEEEILARMKQKWRYNVRLAARKGVRVRMGDEGDLETFVDLMQTTAERNAFGVHSPEYYRRFWELFAGEGRVALFVAEYEGETLAALMLAHLAGRAYYLFGASGNRHRNRMPNHLLQWEAMRWAKSIGCTAYDLWGVPDEVGLDPNAAIPDPASGLWGVWRFKRGFGGEVVRYIGAWDRWLIPMSRVLG